MSSGLSNENADEEKAKLNMEPMVEILPKRTVEPSLYQKIREVSKIFLVWFCELLMWLRDIPYSFLKVRKLLKKGQ